MTDKTTPLIIGKLGDPSSKLTRLLKNSYWVTEEGLLIPPVDMFFGDSFGREYIRLEMTITNNENFAEFCRMYKRTPEQHYETRVNNAKRLLDEILAITDPDNSFGLVELEYRGMYQPDTTEFFNTDSIRKLIELVSHPLYDFEAKIPTQHWNNFKQYWKGLESKYHQYSTARFEKEGFEKEGFEKSCGAPKCVIDLGLKYR